MAAFAAAKTPWNQDILARVRQNCVEQPMAIAIKDRWGSLTYAEFAHHVDSLAALLRQAGVGPGDRVAIHLPNSSRYVIGMFAAASIEALFVPLPHSDPHARAARILESAQPKVVLVDPEDSPAALELNSAHAIPLPTDLVLQPAARIEPLEGTRDPKHPLYIVYTSGSTGTPKGVTIRRESLNNLVHATVQIFGLDTSTVALAVSSFHFDGAFGSIFSVLVVGGTLVIGRRAMLPKQFEEVLLSEAITHTTMSPSYLRFLLGGLGDGVLTRSRLRTIGLGGEECSPDLIRSLRQAAPNVRAFNRYGPTETTVVVTTCELSDAVLARAGRRLPIGVAHVGVALFVLDSNGDRVSRGEVGELCVGGVQVMDGYWGDPALTASVLVREKSTQQLVYRTGDLVLEDDHGQLVYIDRTDDVVNRHGNRIALSEVREALTRTEAVTGAVCIADKRGVGEVRLLAFVTGPVSGDAPAVMRELRKQVPTYMLPDSLVVVDEFPMDVSGKVDFARLKTLAADGNGARSHVG